MALFGKVARRPGRFQQCHFQTGFTFPRQNFRTARLPTQSWLQSCLSPSPRQYRRTFTNSTQWAITGQEAPSAQAYIQSGVIGGKQKLVDVEKVLVIGSGGLSIGQAGEFDYSGKLGMLEGPSFRFRECTKSDSRSNILRRQRSC